LSKVKGPAIALIVAAGIGMLLQLYGIVNSLISLGASSGALQGAAQMQQVEGIDPQMLMNMVKGFGVAGIIIGIVALAIGAVIIFGATKMMKLESRGLAMTSAVLAMIPCISPCCLLGIPFGIWAIVVMNSPEVKSVYR
jgi:hypothetical protein